MIDIANQAGITKVTLYRYFAVDLEKSHRTKFTRNWNGIWTDELVDYALSDVVHLPQLMTAQHEWMGQLGLLEEFGSQMDKVTAALTRQQ